MKSRLGNNPLAALTSTGKKNEFAGRDIQLSIQKVPIGELIPNPLNVQYFKPLADDEMTSLVENIRVNGIHDPLIARRDKTLISGHNRLEAAKKLGLTHVPVRFVLEDMSEQEEIQFIVSDNLLRRHLSTDEKIQLYRVLFPNFDERINVRINAKGLDNVQTLDVQPLNAAEIAQATGQGVEAVRKQLQRAKEKEKIVSPQREQDTASEREKLSETIFKVSAKAKALSEDDRKALAAVLRKVAREIATLST
jgi:ParB-like chromosome segregation protein Spo0J